MPFQLLYIDDSFADRTLLTEIIAQIAPEIDVALAENGEAGLEYLKKNPKPSLVLLDLNMPGMDGFEVLTIIKNDDRLKSLPVIVFSVTTASTHINQVYKFGANAFVNKSLTLDEYKSIFVETLRFWRDIARLPESC